MERAGDEAPGPDGAGAARHTRRRWITAGVFVGAGAILAAGAVALIGRDGGDPIAASHRDSTTTTGAPATAGPAPSGPPTTASPARPPTPATAGRTPTAGTAPGTGATPSPPTSALPGVVDHQEPRAVVQAVVDLATAGATPESAGQYLAGHRVDIVTALFVFLEDGGATGEAGGCTGPTTGARQATCSAHVVTAYGAPADVTFSLGRASATAAWAVTAIHMPPGTPGGPG